MDGSPLIDIPVNEVNDDDPTPFTEVVKKRRHNIVSRQAPLPKKRPIKNPFQTPIFIEGVPEKFKNPLAFVKALLHDLHGIDVKNIRPTKTGYVLDVPSQQDADRLLTNIPQHLGKAHAPLNRAAPLKLILKGVSLHTNPDDMKDLLKDSGITTLSEIIRLRNTRNGQPLPLLLVKTVDDSESRSLLERGELRFGPLAYEVEEFILRPRNIQCFKCMAFGHLAGSCKRSTRCSFCGMSGHSYKDCQRKKAGQPPTCALCNGSHTANSSACPHRRAALEKVLSQERFRDTKIAKEFFANKHSKPLPSSPNPHDQDHFPTLPVASESRIPLVANRPSPSTPRTPPRPQDPHTARLISSPAVPVAWGNSRPLTSLQPSTATDAELARISSDLASLQKQVNDLISSLTPLLALVPLLTQWTSRK